MDPDTDQYLQALDFTFGFYFEMIILQEHILNI